MTFCYHHTYESIEQHYLFEKKTRAHVAYVCIVDFCKVWNGKYVSLLLLLSKSIQRYRIKEVAT